MLKEAKDAERSERCWKKRKMLKEVKMLKDT